MNSNLGQRAATALENFLNKPTTTPGTWRRNIPEQEYWGRLKHELGIIEANGATHQFLIALEFANWFAQKGFSVGPGFGALPCSLVARVLRLTEVNPLEWGLPFERLINPLRKAVPQIVFLIPRIPANPSGVENYIEMGKCLKAVKVLESPSLNQMKDVLFRINQPRRGTDYLQVEEIPLDDKPTFDLLCQGKTENIFQLESDDAQNLLQEFRPKTFSDLVGFISLLRPGPLQSGMFEKFVQRNKGPLTINPPWARRNFFPEETRGMFIYHEQIMDAAHRWAGFSFAEADLMRRAIGKKLSAETSEWKNRFVSGCAKNLIPKGEARELFTTLDDAVGYAFSKSHAIADALIVYRQAFLKANFETEFYGPPRHIREVLIDYFTELEAVQDRGEIT